MARPPRPRVHRSRFGPLAALATAVLAPGCAVTYPLEVTNRSTAAITAELVEFGPGAPGERDWPALLDGVAPIRPGESKSWKRKAQGATYLLAITGPGLDRPPGYTLFAVPDAPLRLDIRGDAQRVNVWMAGDPPILLRP